MRHLGERRVDPPLGGRQVAEHHGEIGLLRLLAGKQLAKLANGPAMAAELRALGIAHPRELAGHDAFALYQALCRHSGKRQDPCVLDTFLAATDFMRGAAPAPWWAYTAQRKRAHGGL